MEIFKRLNAKFIKIENTTSFLELSLESNLSILFDLLGGWGDVKLLWVFGKFLKSLNEGRVSEERLEGILEAEGPRVVDEENIWVFLECFGWDQIHTFLFLVEKNFDCLENVKVFKF